jgi:hypothetical protein
MNARQGRPWGRKSTLSKLFLKVNRQGASVFAERQLTVDLQAGAGIDVLVSMQRGKSKRTDGAWNPGDGRPPKGPNQ